MFYDMLGHQGRHLLDLVSIRTFISKYTGDFMELIEIVAKNDHHNKEKP